MWAYQLIGPRRLERRELAVPPDDAPAPGTALLRLRAAGVCGSDTPFFRSGRAGSHSEDPEPGVPLHEVMGEIVRSSDPRLAPGRRVAGYAVGARGLREYVLTDADALLEVDDSLDDLQAVVIQPLATVLHALDRLPPLRGAHVAVIGQGPIGLLFSHACKSSGAAKVTGVDPVDRSEVARLFGVDEMVVSPSEEWARRHCGEAARPQVAIEAVGHGAGTLRDAIEIVAERGHVFAFGVPDEAEYVFPLERFFRKHLTLVAGTTWQWTRALARAQRYLLEHRHLLEAFVTDVFPLFEAQGAFERAERATVGRIKVLIDATARPPAPGG